MTAMVAIRRKAMAVNRWYRMWSRVAWGLANKQHPLLVHIIPMRRCNLACTYCNEFDDFSPPAPLGKFCRHMGRLAALATSVIPIRGGEPLMHPALDEIIGRIRQ